MPRLYYTETQPLEGWRKKHDVIRFHWWWWVNRFYMRFWFRLSVEGDENIPTSGPAILTSNHIGFLDANIISAASPRKVSFMIAREWHDQTGVNWMCRFLGCIPVNRSGQDIAAVKGALKALSQGHLLGAFPEGGISESGEMRDSKLGIALLAIRSGVPVVPIHLSGYRIQSLPATFLLPKKLSIRVGKPLVFREEDHKNRESLERVTEAVSEAIRCLGNGADNDAG
ncbi:MAG: 1-acyl-sn-glycerol-3-phosphate acyltransferase [Candidatus Omnitrophica bacterium]|nr:1-acyl-sn-glycerol-3-phosphate acyltransferase [Candidatus Omnitrophota bacterium]